MTNNSNPVSVDYSDEKLRIFVEEYITMQKKDFTYKGVCSYILYRAMEDGHTIMPVGALYDSHLLSLSDSDRIGHILKTIIYEGRIKSSESKQKQEAGFEMTTRFEKDNN